MKTSQVQIKRLQISSLSAIHYLYPISPTKFYLFGLFPLITLKYIPDPKMKDQAKFHIAGGLLTKTKNTRWPKFRNVADRKYLSQINTQKQKSIH